MCWFFVASILPRNKTCDYNKLAYELQYQSTKKGSHDKKQYIDWHVWLEI